MGKYVKYLCVGIVLAFFMYVFLLLIINTGDISDISALFSLAIGFFLLMVIVVCTGVILENIKALGTQKKEDENRNQEEHIES